MSTRDRSQQGIETPGYWLDVYGRLSAHGPGHPSQWLGIPLTVTGLTGLLWSMPVPDAFDGTGIVLNWATFFLMTTVVYYFIVSISLAFGTLPFVVAVAALSAWLESLVVPLGPLSAVTFAAALGWQLAEAWRLQGRLEPIRHVQHLMIGPLWLLAACYRRLGIPY